MDTSAHHALDLETAWRRFGDGLRGYFARRVRQPADAEDLVQQVFLNLAKSPPNDVPEERVGAWLYRVARNVLVDAYRRDRVRRTDALAPDVAAGTPGDEGWLALARCLEPMVSALPAPYAEALRRTDLEGETQRALADELGLSHSAVKSRVQRGRVMLRERLVACCPPDDDLECGACDDDTSCA